MNYSYNKSVSVAPLTTMLFILLLAPQQLPAQTVTKPAQGKGGASTAPENQRGGAGVRQAPQGGNKPGQGTPPTAGDSAKPHATRNRKDGTAGRGDSSRPSRSSPRHNGKGVAARAPEAGEEQSAETTPEKQSPRGGPPGATAPARPAEAATNAPAPANNKPGPRRSANHPAGLSGSSGETAAGGATPANGRSGRRGSADKPGYDDATPSPGTTDAPKPAGRARDARGISRTTRANGTVVERDKSGRTTSVITKRGTHANLDRRGHVTSIKDKSGNLIHRGPRGERRVETVRADRTRVVSLGHRGGYVERPFTRGGRQYLQRTYVVGGRPYVRVYRGHYYHGVPYFVYVPPFYYAPAYYGWVYNPWPGPVHYHWGWYGSPWYQPYGYYFAPYAVYPYASLWLTDYLLAENLRLAYEAQPGGDDRASYDVGRMIQASYRVPQQAQGDTAALTPRVKDLIAEEVKVVIGEQQWAATMRSGSIAQANAMEEVPSALDAKHRVFVVFSVLEAEAKGETCVLTASDVLKRISDAPDRDNRVAVEVLASKNGDCTKGSRVRISLTDLNDMLNHLREQLDAGIKFLAEKQGQDGLPPAPPANPRVVLEGTATTDPRAAMELRQQEQEVEQTEKEILQETSTDSPEDGSGSGN